MTECYFNARNVLAVKSYLLLPPFYFLPASDLADQIDFLFCHVSALGSDLSLYPCLT